MHNSEPDIELATMQELGYDTRDIKLPKIILWLSVFAGFVIFSILFGLGIYNAFSPEYKEERALPAFVTAQRKPPFPQLQADPQPEMEQYLAAQEPKHEAIEKAMASTIASGISGVTAETKHEGTAYPGSRTGLASNHSEASDNSKEHSSDEHH
jgi:hypothetical protein